MCADGDHSLARVRAHLCTHKVSPRTSRPARWRRRLRRFLAHDVGRDQRETGDGSRHAQGIQDLIRMPDSRPAPRLPGRCHVAGGGTAPRLAPQPARYALKHRGSPVKLNRGRSSPTACRSPTIGPTTSVVLSPTPPLECLSTMMDRRRLSCRADRRSPPWQWSGPPSPPRHAFRSRPP